MALGKRSRPAQTINVCPVAYAAVPPELVWEVLADPARYEDWLDARLVAAEPPGRVATGQRLEFRAPFLGLGLRVGMLVREVEPARALALRIELPLGIVNDERVTLQPAAGGRTLVRFN